MAVRTDSDGRFRAPRRVPIPDEYFAEVMAPGRLSARSRSVVVTEHGQEIPPVILPLVRTISGQVVDRQGQPVAGALVQQAGDGPMPTSATTDEQGRFQLPGVLEGPAILVVRKPGFRTEPHSLAGARSNPKAGPHPRRRASLSRVQAPAPGFIQGGGSRPRQATRSSARHARLERGHRRRQAPDADEAGGD